MSTVAQHPYLAAAVITGVFVLVGFVAVKVAQFARRALEDFDDHYQ